MRTSRTSPWCAHVFQTGFRAAGMVGITWSTFGEKNRFPGQCSTSPNICLRLQFVTVIEPHHPRQKLRRRLLRVGFQKDGTLVFQNHSPLSCAVASVRV